MTTSEPSSPKRSPTRTSGAEGSHARTSAWQGKAKDSAASVAGSGSSGSDSFATWDRVTSSWKTSQLSLFGGSIPFSGGFTPAGTMRNGLVSRQPTWVPAIFAAASSSSLGGGIFPTPTARDRHSEAKVTRGANAGRGGTPLILAVQGKDAHAKALLPTPAATPYGSNRGGAAGRVGPDRPSLNAMASKGVSLTDWVKFGNSTTRRLATPTAADAKGGYRNQTKGGRCLANEVRLPREPLPPLGGRLSPVFVEQMLGFPEGWTDCAPSETPSSHNAPTSSE